MGPLILINRKTGYSSSSPFLSKHESVNLNFEKFIDSRSQEDGADNILIMCA